MTPAIETGVWLRAAVGLGLGAAAVVGLAAVAAWRVRSGPWRRTIWQAAVAGVLLLAGMEATGVGPGAAAWLLARARNELGHGRSRPAVRACEDREGARWVSVPTAPQPNSAAGAETRRGTSGEAFTPVPVPPPARLSERPRVAATGDVVPPWLAALVWMVGAAVVAGRAAVARVLLARLRRRREPIDAALRRRVRAVAERVGLRRGVRVVASASLAAPLAFGVLRQTVALPHGFDDELDGAAQEAVLAHELAHLAAWDPLWLLAADAATVLLWWHPLVWTARRRLSSACEAAADEASLLVDDGPQRLADCLLRWGRRLRGRRAMAYLGIGGAYRSGLGRRLVRLVALRSENPRTGGRWGRSLVRTAGPILLVMIAMLMTGWARPEPREKGEETMDILRSAWTKSIAGTVVLAVLAGGPDAAVADDRGEGGEEVRRVERDREGDGERREREGDRDHPEARRDGDREHREREGDRRREEAREREEHLARQRRHEEEEHQRRLEEAVRATVERLESRHVSLDFKEVGLHDAVAFLNRLAEGIAIQVAEGIPERPVSLRAEHINLWHALHEITGPGIRLEVFPERVVLVPAGRERRDEPDRERAIRHRDWQREVDGCLGRLSALRRLMRLAQEHGTPEQRELVEHLIHEQEGHYDMLLRRGREEGMEGEPRPRGDRREGEEGARRREGDRARARESDRRREGEGDRWRERDRDREGEEGARRREGDRDREGEGDRGREGDRDREGGEG